MFYLIQNLLPGETQNAVGKRKTGFNAGIDTIIEVRSIDANLAYQSAAVACEILSSDAADDGISSGTLTLSSAVAVTPAEGTVVLANALAIAPADGTIEVNSAVANAQATGTVTCAAVEAADTVTINGLVYTAVAGAKANNTEFSIDTGNTECAADLADSINNDVRSGTAGICSATADTGVVTITTDEVGADGNAVTLVSSNGTRLAVSGAGTLTGGVDADTVTVNGLVYTAVEGAKADNTEFSIDTSDDAAATDLADSITNDSRSGTLDDVTATAATNVVTCVQTVAGAAGNATTLASSSEATRLVISASTFANGVDADTVTVNGLIYTAVAGAKANNTEFSIDTSNDAAATDLADSITNDARTPITVPSIDTIADATTDTVTITAATPGTGGNSISLASSDEAGRLVISGALLTGGLNADVATVNGLTYTAVAGVKANDTQFSIDTSDTAAAADLADSINNDLRVPVTVPSVKVVAIANSAVVTINSNIGGTIGDTIDIAGTSNITASGATLTDVGTGARSVVIEGLDGNYNAITETVFLNGTTAVALSNSYLRINDAYVDEVGSGLVNAGAITIRKTSGAVEQLTIPLGLGQAQSMNYTVPNGNSISIKELELAISQVAANAVVVQVKLWKKLFGDSWRMIEQFTFGNGNTTKKYENDELELPQKTDFKVTAAKLAGTGDATVEAGISYRQFLKV